MRSEGREGRKEGMVRGTLSSKRPVWTTRAHCSRGTLGDRKEWASEVSQSRKMGRLSTNPCQSLVQERLLPRVMNSPAFPPYLPQAEVLQHPEKALRYSAGTYGWRLGVRGNWRAWGDMEIVDGFCCRKHGVLQPGAPSRTLGMEQALRKCPHKGNHV